MISIVKDKRKLKQLLQSDASHNSIRYFVAHHPLIQAMVSNDLGARPSRQSRDDYRIAVERRAIARFLSTPGLLQILVAREHLSEDEESDLTEPPSILALMRLEAGSASTREVNVSLLIREEGIGCRLASDDETIRDDSIPQKAARRVLRTMIEELRRTPNKKNIRACVAEGWQEEAFAEFGFRRLKTQELLKVYPEAGHPKRAVAMRRRLTRWDSVGHIVLLAALLKRGRAIALPFSTSLVVASANPETPLTFLYGAYQSSSPSLPSSSSTHPPSLSGSEKRSRLSAPFLNKLCLDGNDSSHLVSIQKVVILASTAANGEFMSDFFQRCCCWVA
mmetsp:Transcript_58832/g.118156  ORF Transcript_58832/g.118156 Transcript_58832/m.118156 type:complete len:335 (-) Transcript_58832:134-1138(-)